MHVVLDVELTRGSAGPRGGTASAAAPDERRSRIALPETPAALRSHVVAAWSEPVSIDTYLPEAPSRFPQFLDRRVYQGSSGRVFPLPFHERISPEKRPHEWQAVHLENEYVRLMILPELGGRIHVAYDKVADYDFFYRNNVIKPALVGLAGPWLSGGVEFNWPQHHRPATFLPVDVEIEEESDGAVTVWCSDHDPFARMKGMHGVRLRPGSSVVEVRGRLVNRSETTQTFLWWANVAARVHEDYQSFFPGDVRVVADHAKRAFASFPAVTGHYYGVDYPARRTPERPDGDRLDWYRNIPVPTSYMVVATDEDFFGGYDHAADAGFVHWADRRIAPGKKQWTWGSERFGQAWDANLTDDDGPYVELMAGVFTDNQPDFSFLTPGETRTFSQFWYPIAGTGPVLAATLDVAVGVRIPADGGEVSLAVTATRPVPGARVTVVDGPGRTDTRVVSLAPGAATVVAVESADLAEIRIVEDGRELLHWHRRAGTPAEVPSGAVEPPAPEDVATNEELVLLGEYLLQYRHATRSPEPYWAEALRRDPLDVRANLGLGWAAYRRARFLEAEGHARHAIARLTERVPNPSTGEPHYLLGLALVRQGRDDDAAGPLAKAAWNGGWAAPAQLEFARLRSRAGDSNGALAALGAVLLHESEHLQARDLRVRLLRAVGRAQDANALLNATRLLDPLDQFARHLDGAPLTTDAPTLLDVALEYARSGFPDDALDVLDRAIVAAGRTALGQVQIAPLAHYHRAALLDGLGRDAEASAARLAARDADGRFCQPSRLDDVAALTAALAVDPADRRAALLLADWYYDRDRAADAVPLWEVAADGGDEDAVIARRNLGIAAYNHDRDPEGAESWFRSALDLAPHDPKLVYEFDELLVRRGATDALRLELLAAQPEAVRLRDDLTVTHARLLTASGAPEAALVLLSDRHFQPWEGGEGQVLRAWEETTAALARRALAEGRVSDAVELATSALDTPGNLGEARHPLANAAALHLLHGDALAAAGQDSDAAAAWRRAAESSGDFVDMAPQPYSASTPASVLALRRLGADEHADALIAGFAAWIDEFAAAPATVDYFATSLPAMLLFHDDPQLGRERDVAALRTALAGLVPAVATPRPPVQQPGENR